YRDRGEQQPEQVDRTRRRHSQREELVVNVSPVGAGQRMAAQPASRDRNSRVGQGIRQREDRNERVRHATAGGRAQDELNTQEESKRGRARVPEKDASGISVV